MAKRSKFRETFKRTQRGIIRATQWVILRVCLFGMYYVGFGLTRLVMMVFGRRRLYHRPRRQEGTFWRPAVGYEPDEAGMTRQS